MGPDAGQLTSTGVMMGAIAYMSPEQVRAKDLDARTDLFSFGVVLYEMATGRMPFDGSSLGEICGAILHQEPVPPSQVNPRIAPGLEAVIRKALEKDRNLRYQSAAEMRAALQRLQRDTESGRVAAGSSATATMNPKEPVVAKKSWVVIVLSAVVVAVLAAAGIYYRSHHGRRLTDKDTAVIADFTNSTGNSVFDDTLKTTLTIALSQSPFLNVLAENKVGATLKLMTLPAGTRLTPEVAREVCQRARCQAYMAGSIASLGTEYVLGLRAVDCQTGDTLAQEQVTAEAKEKVLNALGAAAVGWKLDPESKAVGVEAALAYAMAGDSSKSEPLARELNARHPIDTQVQSLWLPAIQAQLALNRNDPAAALNDLQAALPPMEYADIPFMANMSCLYTAYVRGEAYVAAGQGREAAAEFQKILDHGGLIWNCWTGALAHLGVARANAL